MAEAATGNKSSMPLQGLVAEGHAIASVDYRLTTQAKFPANVHDIKAAIRFLRAKGPSLGIDAEQIVILSASTGGHLAALVGSDERSCSPRRHHWDRGDFFERARVISFFGASQFNYDPESIDSSRIECAHTRLKAFTRWCT